MKYFKTTIILLFAGLNFYGQDIHFSQFIEASQFVNPANTGRFSAEHRAILNYRSQWASVADPYKTIGFQYDAHIKLDHRDRDALGVGLSFFDDKAGVGDMGIGQIAFALSYTKTMDSKNFFTFGLQAAYAYSHLNIEKFSWDSQYNGSSYNPDLPSNESGYVERFSYFDFNAGVYWHLIANKTTEYFVGASLFHLKNNELEFRLNNSDILNKRYVITAGSNKKINSTLTVKPALFYLHQGAANEFLLGTQLKYMVDEKSNHKKMQDMFFTLGAYYRFNDAFIFSAGYSYMNFTIRFSYDINSSPLAIVSHNKGGFEFSLVYMTPYKRKYKGSSLL
jgi:type IX secretion system PorP/SprF family membrane protein